eukprot:TRINITY_DN3085_c0_g1_i1.p1 TRINITY_DN3085_c0_g1~~TRINITY_DN3085_c0_g1_i1.p1  ORF type:complete len:405 (+),score=130.82 TRINITY_DN3085_c0_g1_i1:1114-2328(+)
MGEKAQGFSQCKSASKVGSSVIFTIFRKYLCAHSSRTSNHKTTFSYLLSRQAKMNRNTNQRQKRKKAENGKEEEKEAAQPNDIELMEKELLETSQRYTAISSNIEQRIAKRMRELEEREKKLAKLDEIMEERVKMAQSKISLDVGGKIFAASKDTLLRFKDTYFSGLLQSEHWQPDKDGRYFIDRNPKNFAIVLDYLRSGALKISKLNKEEKEDLINDFDYYQIDLPEQLTIPEEGLLSYEHRKIVEEWLGGNKQIGERLYRATTDGFEISSFLSKCERKGRTLVVIESVGGWIFGGYAASDWINNSAWVNSTENFLFTLKNPHAIPPTKYPITTYPQNGQYCSPSNYAFGGGHDISIYNQSNANQTSYTNFPYAYSDTTGKGNNTFTGSRNFQAKEVEVYSIL